MPKLVCTDHTMTRSSVRSGTQLHSIRTLDKLLKHKRGVPRAQRALQRKDYAALLKCKCPRLVKYKPSPEIAWFVVDAVMEKLHQRLPAKHIARLLYKQLHRIPLRIGVDKPAKMSTPNTKAIWHGIGVRDNYVRQELIERLKRKGYNCRPTNLRSTKHKFKTLAVLTYN